MSKSLNHPVFFLGPSRRQFAGVRGSFQKRDLNTGNLATSILQDLPTHQCMAKEACALAVPDAAERVCAAIEATLTPP
jgi:UDP-N-acetylglucosamine:LPS N-acetylglucosamine transferase